MSLDLKAIHEGDVLQTGLGCVFLRHQCAQQCLLLLSVSFQLLNVLIHTLEFISELWQFFLLELYYGLPVSTKVIRQYKSKGWMDAWRSKQVNGWMEG